MHGRGVRLSALHLKHAHKRLTGTIVARAPRKLASGAAIVSWQLVRAGRTIAHHAAPLRRGGRTRLTWRLPTGARRGDRLTAVVVTVLQDGGVFSSTTSRVQARI